MSFLIITDKTTSKSSFQSIKSSEFELKADAVITGYGFKANAEGIQATN
jgi:hypothetical protein